jgi:ABC-type transport system involved in multi-copper enzyme maturation permease subunit
MKWVAWRQSRLELIIGLVVLAGLAALLVPIGLQQLSLFKNLGLATMSSNDAAYASLSQQFLDSYPQWINVIVNLSGVLLFIFGALLAVPIILEFEQRTYRLAWTQSITRKRWLLTKLGFALVAAVVISALYIILMTWFLGPLNSLTGEFNNFSQQGIVPVSYTVFGFAVALAAGILSRRSSVGVIVAVVACLVATTIALPVLSHGLPLNYLKPLEEVSAFTLPTPIPGQPGQDITVRIGADLPVGSLVVSNYFIDASGNKVPIMQVRDSSTGSPISQVTEYQPANRYWAFQGIEAFIFFGASIVLLYGSFLVIVRRSR